MKLTWGIAAWLLLFTACSDAVDKAAKKRIFSPEDPPLAISQAAEKLPPEEVASKPAIARRVLGMSEAEVTERIGAHRFTADVQFEWLLGKSSVKLSETRKLLAGPGGVSGDFQAVVENNRDQGLDVLRAQGSVFAKGRYGKYRERRRDRGMAERAREETQGVLRDMDHLFLGRLKLSPAGTATHEGRTAWKYDVSLGPAAPADASGADEGLPPKLEPKRLLDDTARRRRAFEQKREPVSLQGQVWVDAATSVVLKSRLDGRIKVPSNPEGKGEAQLRISATTELVDIGKDPHLTPPKEYLPDEDKPEGIAEVLERFGIPHGETGRDAGTGSVEDPTDEAN